MIKQLFVFVMAALPLLSMGQERVNRRQSPPTERSRERTETPAQAKQHANNDTLRIEQAVYQGAVAIRAPYFADSLNAENKAYDPKRILDRNVRTAAFLGGKIGYGEAIKGEGLHYFAFTITPDRWVSARLLLSGFKNYKLYVDGKEEQAGSLKLTPQQHSFVVSLLIEKEGKDTFQLKVVYPKEASLAVNSTQKRPYTVEDQSQGISYAGVSLSPSGKFLLTTYREVDSKGVARSYTALTEVSNGKLLARFDGARSYAWLPQKDLLYQAEKRGEHRSIITLNPTTLQESVFAENVPQGNFRIAPSLDYLIYSVSEGGGRETPALRELQMPDDRMPNWRNRSSLYVYCLKTGLMQPLTYGGTTPSVADFSPDGKRILMVSSRRDIVKIPTNRSTLLEMNIETGAVDTIFHEAEYLVDFNYSPDGKSLIVKGSPFAFDKIGAQVAEGQIASTYDHQLYLYDLATRKVTPLTMDFNPAVASYQWSKCDGMVYFTADDKDCTHLFSLNPQTKKITYIPCNLDVIQGYSIAENAPVVAVYGQTAETARTLYVGAIGSKLKKTGDYDWAKEYANVAIGHCEDWSFLTTRGDSIAGRFYLPPSFDAGKKYPVVVYYYGGCTPTKRNLEFSYALQVLAGQGYVVYVVQPSGTIGYGQEFSARHVNAWGQRTASDIIEGVKAFCATHPYADSAHIGCMGASYGGFMTQYLQTQTDIFATAISHAGISNIASYWGGGYWGYSYSEMAATGSFPWNNPELYVEQSPLFLADKINTPILLLHGTADTNVPTNESQQLFTALKLLGKEVAYVQVDGENHGITDFAKRRQWQHTIFAWLAKYLKEQPAWWEDLYPKKNY